MTPAARNGSGPERTSHLVNDRPVMLVPTDDGGLDCVVYDHRTGSFVIDRSYFTRTIPGYGSDVDGVSNDEMDAIVGRLRAGLLGRMADALGEHRPADGEALLSTLGLGAGDGAVPFDGSAVELLAGPGLLVVHPQLLRRSELERVLGEPTVTDGPDGTSVATYRRPGCAVLAVFPTGRDDPDAVLVSLTLDG